MTRPTLVCLLLLAGCAEDAATPPPAPMRGELDLEIRDTASVTIESGTVTLTATAGFGLLEANKAMTAALRVDRLPEASATLYTARFSAPAQNGLCGTEPVSLALSLHRQADNARVVGGLTAYCGADTWYGVPARVLRLSGELR